MRRTAALHCSGDGWNKVNRPVSPRTVIALSGPANPKKLAPQPAASKAMQVGAAKTPVKPEELSGERVTKQERMLTLLSQPWGEHRRDDSTSDCRLPLDYFSAQNSSLGLGESIGSRKSETPPE
jgi:hypothetical protein